MNLCTFREKKIQHFSWQQKIRRACLQVEIISSCDINSSKVFGLYFSTLNSQIHRFFSIFSNNLQYIFGLLTMADLVQNSSSKNISTTKKIKFNHSFLIISGKTEKKSFQ
jgi:hypothetical protein